MRNAAQSALRYNQRQDRNAALIATCSAGTLEKRRAAVLLKQAQRSKATAREISASHVPFLSHPEEVAHIILQAANTVVPA